MIQKTTKEIIKDYTESFTTKKDGSTRWEIIDDNQVWVLKEEHDKEVQRVYSVAYEQGRFDYMADLLTGRIDCPSSTGNTKSEDGAEDRQLKESLKPTVVLDSDSASYNPESFEPTDGAEDSNSSKTLEGDSSASYNPEDYCEICGMCRHPCLCTEEKVK